MSVASHDCTIRYDVGTRRWYAVDGREVRLRWGYSHGFSLPKGDSPVKIEFTLRGVLYEIYQSHFDGEFYIREPQYPLHDKVIHEFGIPNGHPCFVYFRKVFYRNGKEYERTLAHDDTWQSYGHDDGKVVTSS